MPDEPQLLISTPASGVRLICLNRPAQRNALTLAMQERLDEHLAAFAGDDTVGAIVLSGAGDKAFSAGYDIYEMQHFDEAALDAAQQRREHWLWRLATYAKPIVAAVNGAAHGVGAIIATAVDIRIGCPATNFRYTAGAYGYANNTWQLAPVVGLAKAKEYLLTAAPVSADEALRSGLLNQLVDAASLQRTAVDMAATIAANPSAGMQATKRLLHEAIGDSYEAAYRRENALMHGALKPGKPADMFKDFLGKPTKP